MPEIPVTSAKKAVLVGVHLKRDQVLGKVPGAHKDAKKLRDLLVNTYQYDPNDITFLTDSEKLPQSVRAEHWPTRENILKAMRELVKDRQRGDHIVFSFSGHGDQAAPIKDKNETDGQDETLMPADYEALKTGPNAWKYSHFIRDDEIREIFVDGLTEGVQCTLIFDCCHSGTACDLPEEGNDELEGDDGAKGLQPGAPGFAKRETVHHQHAARAKEGDSNMAVVTGANGLGTMKEVTSWSACSDDQVTYSGTNGGQFINAFIDILQSANGKTITHRELLLGLRTKLETVTREANLKRDEGQPELKTPRPQLGSLIPECILDKRLTL